MRTAQREYECDSELGHGIHEIMEHGSQSKHDRWETRGARCSQRERQGNGESFYKHRNIDMDLGPGGGGNTESLTKLFRIVSGLIGDK